MNDRLFSGLLAARIFIPNPIAIELIGNHGVLMNAFEIRETYE
jgi:hypothetical protein